MTHTDPHALETVSDPKAAAISGAEERLAMLRRLASLGMRLAEEVVERAVNSPYHPEVHHEPARAFATVSRAVRLTLVLQAKAEAILLALCNGKSPAVDAGFDLRPNRSGETARAAPHGVSPDEARGEGALDPLDPARENLCESERFDEMLSRPFETCVTAIRADLGLGADADADAGEAPDYPSPLGSLIPSRPATPVATPSLRVGALDPPSSA